MLDVLDVIRLIKRRPQARSPDQPENGRDHDQRPERLAGCDSRNERLTINYRLHCLTHYDFSLDTANPTSAAEN